MLCTTLQGRKSQNSTSDISNNGLKSRVSVISAEMPRLSVLQ